MHENISAYCKTSKVWKDILGIGLDDINLRDNIAWKWRVGKGSKVRFWEDFWCDPSPLKFAYPRLYALSTVKQATLQEVKCELGWDLKFRRNLHQWEIEEWDSLKESTSNCILDNDKDDLLIWSSGVDGILSVKNYLQTLVRSRNLVHYLWEKLVWKKELPSKIQMFFWLTAQDALATKVFLARRGIIFYAGSISCVWCNNEDEDSAHLLMHCPWAWKVWCSIYSWWSLNWVSPYSFLDFLNACSYWKSTKLRQWWTIITGYTFWGIWEARNKAIFNKEIICWKDVVYIVQFRSLKWIASKSLKSSCNSHKWYEDPWVLIEEF